jgi:hypothetical protein
VASRTRRRAATPPPPTTQIVPLCPWGQEVRVGPAYQTAIPICREATPVLPVPAAVEARHAPSRPRPILLDERTFLLTSYVDILVDERYNPSLKLHRLRDRPRLALCNDLASLVGEDRVRQLEGWIGATAATDVPWGLVASAVGMDEDEAAAFVARREREPEVMRKRRTIEEEEAGMTLARFAKKQGRPRGCHDVKLRRDEVRARVRERSEAERALAAGAKICLWVRRRRTLASIGGKRCRCKRAGREDLGSVTQRESQGSCKKPKADVEACTRVAALRRGSTSCSP